MRLVLEANDRVTSSIRAVRTDHLTSLSRKFVPERQRFLCDLLASSYERRHVHHADPQADSFSREYLRKGLRVSPGKAIIPKYLGELYSFEEGNGGYSKDGGLTKAYRLRESVRATLDEVYTAMEPLPIDAHGIPEGSANGLPPGVAGEGIFVPAHLPVSWEHLCGAEDRLRRWMEPDNHNGLLDPHRGVRGISLRSARQIVRACMMWHRSLGGVPNLYRLQSHGRLGPRGGAVHIISLPRTVRHLLLQDSGLEDFDLVSCHWSILRSTAQSLGVDTPWIDTYLDQKEEWHFAWSQQACCFPSEFKPITVSWLTGAALSSSPRTAGTQAIGQMAMEHLKGDPRAQALYRETQDVLRRVMSEVVERVGEGQEAFVVNAVGQERSTRGLSRAKLFSHVLTGFEQFAIRACCRRVVHLQAIIYDGFVAPPQDVAPLEAAIREESSKHLGITLDLRIKRKPFSSRIVDRFAFDPDFDEDYLDELAAA